MNIRFPFFQIVPKWSGPVLPKTDNNGHMHHEPGGLSNGQTEVSSQDWIM